MSNDDVVGIIASNKFLDFVKEAKIIWIKYEQSKLVTVKNFVNLKKQLRLFKDEHGLFRCEGRLKFADLDYDTKNPYLITKSNFAKLVVRKAHEQVNHTPPETQLINLDVNFELPNQEIL